MANTGAMALGTKTVLLYQTYVYKGIWHCDQRRTRLPSSIKHAPTLLILLFTVQVSTCTLSTMD